MILATFIPISLFIINHEMRLGRRTESNHWVFKTQLLGMHHLLSAGRGRAESSQNSPQRQRVEVPL